MQSRSLAIEHDAWIEVDESASAHTRLVAEALRELAERSGIRWIDRNAGQHGATQTGLLLNLFSHGESLPGPASGIEFLVEEGLWLYRLGSPVCGWGSVEAGVERGRLLIVRTRGADGETELLAEAEIRTSMTRPWRNAGEFGAAAAVLIHEGCLARRGRPIVLSPLRAPRLRLRDRARWLFRSFLPSVVDSLAWKLGLAPRLQWSIGVMPGQLDPASGWSFPLERVRWIDPPDNGIIADPFVIKHNGTHWLFYEHMLFDEGKGTIHAGQLDPETGTLRGAREVLATPHHLSFPNVFQADGHWYMLPEQAQSGSVKLYRADAFPWQWTEYRELLAGFPGIDPVLLRHDDKWWLFVTRDGGPCVDNNLHLYWSDSLDGEFVAHPLNPIRTGLFGSRMAGAILRDGDALLRPAQDGRAGYGAGLALYRIEELTTTSYRESELCAWRPSRSGPFRHGFHALHACEDAVVVDAQRMRPVPPRERLRRRRTGVLMTAVVAWALTEAF